VSNSSGALAVLVTGVVVLGALSLKPALRKLRVTPVVGYLLVGVLLRVADLQTPFLSAEIAGILDFLGTMGVIVLLFDVGLKSHLSGLLKQLSRASSIWLVDITLNFLVGFCVPYAVLGVDWLASLFVGCAFTATSVGVAVGVWKQQGRLETPTGELLTDVAELDDLSGVILAAVLLSLVPALMDGAGGALLPRVVEAAKDVGIGLVLFTLLCLVFAVFMEHPLTGILRRIPSRAERAYLVLGTGLLIAALAALLGFSPAIGAFFAGLAFSRDQKKLRIEGAFSDVYEFFVPFFFIGIGLQVEPTAVVGGLGVGGVLLVAAFASKFVAASVPALLITDRKRSVLLGVSMVPRAEIALLVMKGGLEAGSSVVPEEIYMGMVFVSAGTCLGAPLILSRLFRSWPLSEDRAGGSR
jgi:Kef-type K+ transport system membrane component KefB